MNFIRNIILRFKQKTCKHVFKMRDLEMVNKNGLHDRVKWPCMKCGKIFYAHCGLDIAPKHGEVIYSPNTSR